MSELIPTGATFGEGRESINTAFSGEALFNIISATTIYSGGTDLSDIFITEADVHPNYVDAQIADYTLLASDAGKSIFNGNTAIRTVTIGFGLQKPFDLCFFQGKLQLSILAGIVVTTPDGDVTNANYTLDTTKAYSFSRNGSTGTNWILSDLTGTGGGSGDVTRVGEGVNIYTGGTSTNPIINVVDSPVFTNVSATTFYSGSTDLSEVFASSNVFTSSQDGLAPSSNGGTTNFLRADGTWKAPSGETFTVTFAEGGGVGAGDIFQVGGINNLAWAIPFDCTVLEISVFYNLIQISFGTNSIGFSLREVNKGSGQLTSGGGTERYSIVKSNTPATIYSDTLVLKPTGVSFSEGNSMMLSVPVAFSFVTLNSASVLITLKKD